MSKYSELILRDGPAAYYRFTETSGSTAIDSSPNGYNGTISGTITKNQAGVIRCDPNASYLFDGTSGIVTCPTGLDTTSWTTLTVEFWWKLINNVNFTTPIGNAQPSNSGVGWSVYVNNPDSTIHGQFGTNPSSFDVASIATISLGSWQHVVLTGDATALKFYINGVPDLTNGRSMPTLAHSTSNVVIGYDVQGAFGFVNGNMDEVAIYNKVLTADQIANHYKTALSNDLLKRLKTQHTQ